MSIHAEYQAKVIQRARAYLGVRERGKNRGEQVEYFQRQVGIPPGAPWCAGYAYTPHLEAAAMLGGTTTCPRTGGAVAMYLKARQAHGLTFRPLDVLRELIYPEPGDLFVRVRRGKPGDVAKVLRGLRVPGHVGLVEGMDGHGVVHTLEGNTNAAGSREGDGVYQKTLNLDMPELVGFVRPTLVLSAVPGLEDP